MRPFIEFIHSQRVPATTDVLPGPRRVLATKTLSRDDTTRECTTIVTYERGASFDETRFGGFDEEIFVLTGELETSFGTLGRHGYAYWPAGTPRKISTRKGAVVLTCLNLDPKATPDGYRKEGLVRGHDSIAQPWDRTNMDPKDCAPRAVAQEFAALPRRNDANVSPGRIASRNSTRQGTLGGTPSCSRGRDVHGLRRHSLPAWNHASRLVLLAATERVARPALFALWIPHLHENPWFERDLNRVEREEGAHHFGTSPQADPSSRASRDRRRAARRSDRLLAPATVLAWCATGGASRAIAREFPESTLR